MKKPNGILICAACLLSLPGGLWAQFNPFAAAVIDTSLNGPNPPAYLPAPSSLVNDSAYNDAARALGAPVGGGTFLQDNSSVVSLGGFGGSITLAFDHDVADSPANPMGLDAIVFSNAIWTQGSSQLHWSEPATIEIMPELNGSGVPGDDPGEKWYLIPGSHLSAGATRRTVTWTRAAVSPSEYPAAAGWPDAYDTSGYLLTPAYQTINGTQGNLMNPNFPAATEGYWGYAEYTPTAVLGDRNADNALTGAADAPGVDPRVFYTTPDDPMTVGLSGGAGGGDAFDIAWAVDPDTWIPAGLARFRYVRLTTAVDQFFASVGRVSAEIDAAADVRMVCDLNGDGAAGLDDYARMSAAMGSTGGGPGYDAIADINADGAVGPADRDAFLGGWWALYLPGDANRNGSVDVSDLSLLAGSYRKTSGQGWENGDFNLDGAVDVSDLSLLATNYRKTYGVPPTAGLDGAAPATVPEPGVTGLALAALTILLARRRRGRRQE